jgi:hypothetical protein
MLVVSLASCHGGQQEVDQTKELMSLRVGQQLTPDRVDWLSTKTIEFREVKFIEETITHTQKCIPKIRYTLIRSHMCVALKGKLKVSCGGPVIPKGLSQMDLILPILNRLKFVAGRATKASPCSKIGC